MRASEVRHNHKLDIYSWGIVLLRVEVFYIGRISVFCWVKSIICFNLAVRGEYSKFIGHWVKSYYASTCSRGLENIGITLICQERSSLIFVFRRGGRAKILSMKFEMYSKSLSLAKRGIVNSNFSSSWSADQSPGEFSVVPAPCLIRSVGGVMLAPPVGLCVRRFRQPAGGVAPALSSALGVPADRWPRLDGWASFADLGDPLARELASAATSDIIASLLAT